jgi:RecA/RadA recombinase
MPSTPADIFKELYGFIPTGEGIIDCVATDSIAAIVASAEMEPPKAKKGDDNPLIADKMGGMKPKEMHALLRKSVHKIKNTGLLCLFTNQLHDSMSSYGPSKSVPGGHAIPYYTVLRIELKQTGKIEEKIGFIRELKNADGKEVKKRIEHDKIIGIECKATLVKNHIDDPWREAPLRIIFGYGFDDVGANLTWIKQVLGLNQFLAVDKSFTSLLEATQHIEKMDLETDLRHMVTHYWREIETRFAEKTRRKPRS